MPSPVHYLLQQNAGNGGLVGLMNSAEFILPLGDSGNGAVDMSLGRGVGPATFTRATAAATKLSTGLWKLDVASGTARSSYIGLNTAVSAYGGYLAEGAATQLAVDVRDMTQASWVKVTMTTAKTSTGIDGVANSCTRLTAAGAASTILQTLVAVGSSRTYSCWMKRVTGTGTILIQQGATTLDVTALINSATFTLVQLNANVLNSAFGIAINTSTDAIDVDCNQFEAGAFATTPIPAAGTRNADVLTYPSAGNIPLSPFTIYQEIVLSGLTTNDWAFDSSIAGGGVDIVYGANGNFRGPAGANPTNHTWATTAVNGVLTKVAVSLSGTNCSVAENGALPVLSSSLINTPTAHTSIGLSNNAGGSTFIMRKNFRVWQRQLPDAASQAITA